MQYWGGNHLLGYSQNTTIEIIPVLGGSISKVPTNGFLLLLKKMLCVKSDNKLQATETIANFLEAQNVPNSN